VTDHESPADVLRRAADRLDELDKAAAPGPWWIDRPLFSDFCLHTSPSSHEIGSTGGLEDAALIVAMRSVAAPLAAHLRATADRWDEHVLLDRPESPDMEPALPYAWWCGFCDNAVESPDYPREDQRCRCGWWVEALALARAVLGEQETSP
jgi:hypothetical protein